MLYQRTTDDFCFQAAPQLLLPAPAPCRAEASNTWLQQGSGGPGMLADPHTRSAALSLALPHAHREVRPTAVEEVGDVGSTQIEKLRDAEQTSDDRNHRVNAE